MCSIDKQGINKTFDWNLSIYMCLFIYLKYIFLHK